MRRLRRWEVRKSPVLSASSNATSPAMAPDAPTTTVTARGGSIWLVEDSPLEAELARRALSGFAVAHFLDGPSMLERQATHGSPSVLILDWQLPGMSGLEICRFLRATLDEATLPILMLTVQGNKADVVEALSAGANDYLTKPYDAAELVARVGGMCRARRLYEDLQVERQRLRAVNAERERLLAYAQEGWTRAEEANGVKDDFLAVVSHELRTPLNAISGWIAMLRSTELSPEKISHALETIDRNARAQTQLIDDLLDVSRIISGKLHLQKDAVRFDTIVRLAVDGVEPTAKTKEVQLRTEIAPGRYDVTGDPVRLQQVVWNLLTNAVKFTPKGGLVTVKLSRNGVIRLRVTDTGRGIAPGLLSAIFDRFRQAEGTATRRHGGLGLGLAIVKHLVQLHGGTVKAESAGEGHGATFTVEFTPMPASGSSPVAADEPDARSTRSRSNDLAGLRILVVDDDADGRDMLAELLTMAGAQISTADSAATALAALEEDPPDVLVSDIGMPDEDGLQLIRQLRQRGCDGSARVPAVAVTAYARGQDRASALRAGFNAHVSKPIDMHELIAVIASLSGRFLTADA
jgi:signal transduction histidine kinase